jgi:hypothetical protein
MRRRARNRAERGTLAARQAARCGQQGLRWRWPWQAAAARTVKLQALGLRYRQDQRVGVAQAWGQPVHAVHGPHQHHLVGPKLDLQRGGWGGWVGKRVRVWVGC